MSQADFPRNDATGKDMIGTRSKCQSFGKYYKMFKAVTLLQNSNKRKRLVNHVNVDLKLVRYINHQARIYKQDKCGMSWSFLQKRPARMHWMKNPTNTNNSASLCRFTPVISFIFNKFKIHPGEASNCWYSSDSSSNAYARDFSCRNNQLSPHLSCL